MDQTSKEECVALRFPLRVSCEDGIDIIIIFDTYCIFVTYLEVDNNQNYDESGDQTEEVWCVLSVEG